MASTKKIRNRIIMALIILAVIGIGLALFLPRKMVKSSDSIDGLTIRYYELYFIGPGKSGSVSTRINGEDIALGIELSEDDYETIKGYLASVVCRRAFGFAEPYATNEIDGYMRVHFPADGGSVFMWLGNYNHCYFNGNPGLFREFKIVSPDDLTARIEALLLPYLSDIDNT